ncbi:MAG TPA: response regulator [Pyrinomonadaceae bacterium]|nr:response regulator [Pyrinomonadaceae bacterium]
MKLRTLVVDDEPLARKRILRLLGDEPDVEVIGECSDGLEAVAAVRERSPDLVFLDVQMPELDGLGVLEEVGGRARPFFVLVTAYDHYAESAGAHDYILKPFDRERLRGALDRARARLCPTAAQ